MITLIPQKIKFKNNGIFKGYHCENGAEHSYNCCETCWNQHPNEELHLGKLSTSEAIYNYRKYQKEYDLPVWAENYPIN